MIRQLEEMDIFPEDGDADLKPEIDGRQKCQQDQWRDGDDGSTAGCGKSPD